MLQRILVAAFVSAGCFCLAGAAFAQNDAGSVVSGSARVRLQPKPNKLRLQMQLRAYGATTDAALKNLKARREAAVEQLKKLDADAASIALSVPSVGLPSNVMAGRTGVYAYSTPVASPGPAVSAGTWTPPLPPAVPAEPVEVTPSYAPPSTYPPPTVTPAVPAPPARPARPRSTLVAVSMTLRAEWPLPTGEAEEIVAAAETIRAKVRAATLANEKAARARLTPEEQETLEEAEMGQPFATTPANIAAPPIVDGMSYSPAPGSSIGGLADRENRMGFVYVAVLSEKQRKKLLADTYAKVKREAEQTAEAAGMRLAGIVNLRSGVNSSRQALMGFASGYNSLPLVSWDESESVATEPDRLEFACDVSATYRLQPTTPNS